MRGAIALTACSALAISLLAAGPADAARSGALPRICAAEEAGAQQWGTDLSRLSRDGVIVLDGRELRVTGEEATWRLWDDADPAFATRFHSMSWVVPGLRQGLPVVEMLLERGDMQFINNYHVLHGRRSYVDDRATGRVRFLKRLWLATDLLGPDDRPPQFQRAGATSHWASTRSRAS